MICVPRIRRITRMSNKCNGINLPAHLWFKILAYGLRLKESAMHGKKFCCRPGV